MRLTLDLATDESLALRRFATDQGLKLPHATQLALREWLIGAGYLEPEHELDEDTETAGEA